MTDRPGGEDRFDMGGGRIWSIPPTEAFLARLADGLVEATGALEDPMALGEALVFLPNRRSARALTLALHARIGRPFLAPDIKPLGDFPDDSDLALLGADALDTLPELPPARRRGALVRLVQAFRAAQGQDRLPPHAALFAADELSALLEQAALSEEVDWSRLPHLVADADLAAHWQASAGFLGILAEHWPAHLAESGACDAMQRRRIAAERLSARWAANPPDRFVVIAGSTGATRATRLLMQATLRLPRGAIVLPGYDLDQDEAGWEAISRTPSHPQHAFAATLSALGRTPEDVRRWPLGEETAAGRARRRLVNEALAPAESTKGWNARLAHLAQPGAAADLVREGLSGVRLLEAEDENEEALVAALLLRETLETPGRTAALVTPDAGLARRVAALLGRWNIAIRPSAGEPFDRTAPGSFVLLLFRWLADPVDPVRLLAVLKHELCALGRDRADLDTAISALERACLRGPRRDDSLDQLHARLLRDHPGLTDAAALVDSLRRTLGLIPAGADPAEQVARLAEALSQRPGERAGDRLWRSRNGETASRFLEDLADLASEMGGVSADDWPDLAEQVARGVTCPSEAAEHPRLAIWGPLEARLQRRDRMILASLNEGSWPRPTAPDPFLNRRLRRDLGLPDPEERIGLSAHDFAQLACGPELVLLRSARVEDKPAVASRWLWRLQTLAGGGLGSLDAAMDQLTGPAEDGPISWARALRRVEKVTPARPPEPRPPVEARQLERVSPSRTSDLIRDPYKDYCKRLLNLAPLERPGAPLAANTRGQAVHKAVEDFQNGAFRDLEAGVRAALLDVGFPAGRLAFEAPLWARAATAFQRWQARRAGLVRSSVREAKAAIRFEAAGRMVELSAKADLVELFIDGTCAIVDVKTGKPPTAKEVNTGLAPQLSLEAAISVQAGFGAMGPTPVSQLVYFQFSTARAADSEKNGEPLRTDKPIDDLAQEALDGLVRLMTRFADPATSYPSKPRAQFAWTLSDYDRLARRAEWTVDPEGDAS